MNTKSARNLFCLGVLASALAACGGGGGNSDFDPVQNTADSAQGFWEGTSSAGFSVAVAILENGETWGVYTTAQGIAGAVYGNTESSDGRLGGHGKEFNIATRTVTGLEYLGNYVPCSTITATTSTGIRLSGSYRDSYLEPASLSRVEGAFTGTAVTGRSPIQSISFTVAPNGVITIAPSLGCSMTGSAKPRPSRRNVFDVSVSFSGASCALGNGATATGIAHYEMETRRLIVMGMNAGKSDGFIAVARKL